MEELLKKITELCENDRVSEATQLVQNQDIIEYPIKPSKPILPKMVSSSQFIGYGKELELYEKEMDAYKVEKQNYDNITNKIESHLIECLKDVAGLNTIPEQYRSGVYSYAYSEGHSAGYYEVFLKLNSLISTIF